MFLAALNLRLSVVPSAPIIANYLLQPQAMCQLACSNHTLLFLQTGLRGAPKTAHEFLAAIIYVAKFCCVRRMEEAFRCSQVFFGFF